MSEPLLRLEGVSKSFSRSGRRLAAVDGVSLTLAAGETLGIVGPSGCGKTTLARLVMQLVRPDAGSMIFGGVDLLAQRGPALRRLRKDFQMVFQDPLAAFNPRASVGGALADPLRLHGLAPAAERPARVAALLDSVGLDPALAGRAIHEISGGQRQRVAIARAMASSPRLIVLDEAVSALDVSVRAQVLELLVALQRRTGVGYLFVSHDLAVVRAVSHRIAVMDRGRIVETGPALDLVANPRSATGQALVAAVPKLMKD